MLLKVLLFRQWPSIPCINNRTAWWSVSGFPQTKNLNLLLQKQYRRNVLCCRLPVPSTVLEYSTVLFELDMPNYWTRTGGWAGRWVDESGRGQVEGWRN